MEDDEVVVELEGVLEQPARGHFWNVKGRVQQVDCIGFAAKVVAIAEVLRFVVVLKEGAYVAN